MAEQKILIVFGTRPETIKMAPLIHELAKYPEHFKLHVVVTGQHQEMLDSTLSTFDIVPDVNLKVMRKGQDLYHITSEILLGLRGVIKSFKPDLIMVHGDTTTTLAGSLASFYENIPLSHIEAGMRTGDLYSPYPEEFNRRVTSLVAAWHFAPTDSNRDNLLQERVVQEKIIVTGNTVIDALFWILGKISSNNTLKKQIEKQLDEQLPFAWRDTDNILITGHRRESFGPGFMQICQAVRELAEQYPEKHFIYPVHLNPNVRRPVHELLAGLANVHLLEPLNYETFVYLMQASYLVLTDSGGIQEEAPSLGKPVLVMRECTERPEAIQAGTVRLVGTDKENIVENCREIFDNEKHYASMARAINPYGDGKACARIVKALLRDVMNTSRVLEPVE